jgi:hypothetical protein
MGRSLTTNEESRWATPLSFLALSSSACWRRRRRASFFTYRCWRFQSSVWGRGTSLLDALKAQKNLWVFVIAASLPLFFHENFFRDFTCLDWFDPVDSSSTITCSFRWFFLFVFFFWWWEVGGLSQDELFGDYCALLQFWRYFEVRSTAFSFLSSYVFFVLSWAYRDVIETIRFLLKTEVEVFLCLSSFSLGGLKVLNLSPWSLDLWMQA